MNFRLTHDITCSSKFATQAAADATQENSRPVALDSNALVHTPSRAVLVLPPRVSCRAAAPVPQHLSWTQWEDHPS